MKEVRGTAVFRDLKGDGQGYFVITDTTGNKVHDVKCSFVNENNFAEKVLVNRNKNGRYYWVPNLSAVDSSLRIQKCSHCL